MNNNQFNHIYIIERLKNFAGEAANHGQFVVAFKPKNALEQRCKAVNMTDFHISDIFDSYLDYRDPVGFMEIQMLRCGGTRGDIKVDVLKPYAMMMTGVVVVSEAGSTETHIYTLCPPIAASFVGNNYGEYLLNSNLESKDVEKDTITCLEIIPYKKNGTWLYDCDIALYKMKPNQILTYAVSAVIFRYNLMNTLMKGLIDIEFRDFKKDCDCHLCTSLSPNILSAFMKREVYDRIVEEAADETRMLTLRLPNLKSNNKMVDVPLLAIKDYKCVSPKILIGGNFNPYKRVSSGGGGKQKNSDES